MKYIILFLWVCACGIMCRDQKPFEPANLHPTIPQITHPDSSDGYIVNAHFDGYITAPKIDTFTPKPLKIGDTSWINGTPFVLKSTGSDKLNLYWMQVDTFTPKPLKIKMKPRWRMTDYRNIHVLALSIYDDGQIITYKDKSCKTRIDTFYYFGSNPNLKFGSVDNLSVNQGETIKNKHK